MTDSGIRHHTTIPINKIREREWSVSIMPHLSWPKTRDHVQGDDPMVAEAIRFMEKALNLFDHAGVGTTAFACHLSMAIDCAQAAFDADAARMLALLRNGETLQEGESLH